MSAKWDVYFLGGSHMAGYSVSSTQAIPVLVMRELRRRLPGRIGHAHVLGYRGHPAGVLPELAARRTGERALLICIPRNVGTWPSLADMRRTVRGWLGIDFAIAPRGTHAVGEATPFRGRLRLVVSFAWYSAWLIDTPRTLGRFRGELEEVLAWFRARGGRAVIATPVPLQFRGEPALSWHQLALARTVRRMKRDDVLVADLFGQLRRAPWLSDPSDPGHLSVAGSAAAAGLLAGAAAAAIQAGEGAATNGA